MNDREAPPLALREAVARDLEPMQALAPPHVRALWMVPVALVLFTFAPAALSVRGDTQKLGFLLSWGASFLETALGLGIVAIALREAVPGTLISRRIISLVWALAIGTVTLITIMTWRVSPTPLLQDGLGFVWRVCVAGTFVSALPALALSLLLIRRAFPLRPALAGALCGVGSGLLADSGWRMFCHFTDPAHVFGAHLFGVAAVTVTGALFARRG